MGYTESGQSRANKGIPRFACNPDLNHARQWLNVHGANDLANGKTRMLDVLTVNAASTIMLLMAI